MLVNLGIGIQFIL